jgi:hypothetical protein
MPQKTTCNLRHICVKSAGLRSYQMSKTPSLF